MALQDRITALAQAVGADIKALQGAGSTGGMAIVITPTNVSPLPGITTDRRVVDLVGSAFYSLYNEPQSAVQVQVSTTADFTTPFYDSGDSAPGTSVALPGGTLQVATSYHWRIRYKNARGLYSAWSEPTQFATAAVLGAYAPIPTPTPAEFGAALEGGYYAGMVWNELVQSDTSTVIGTGTRAFTVPDMDVDPIAYPDQVLEVRSRANPNNKMVGVVAGAAGTTLTLNVTSVGGGGTFTDWSIMSRYRVILAPKAGGENTSVAYKNANSAAPAACGTLTEGRKATLAMVGAGTAAVYPAAHWCNSLTVGGKTDWYLPARDELELCYRNLKPTLAPNYLVLNRPSVPSPNYQNLGSYGGAENTHGLNKNSAPPGAAYTDYAPTQTGAVAFQLNGAEAFETTNIVYTSSSEYNSGSAWTQTGVTTTAGRQTDFTKSTLLRIRAVRRSIV